MPDNSWTSVDEVTNVLFLRRCYLRAIATSVVLMLAGVAISNGEEMKTRVYPLTDEQYESIPVSGVFEYNCPNNFLSLAHQKNPKLSAYLRINKVATIEIHSPYLDGLGSRDPFMLAGRQEAAKLGANCLVYESGTSLKNTERFASFTYTAVRMEYAGVLAYPGSVYDLIEKPLSISRAKYRQRIVTISNAEYRKSDDEVEPKWEETSPVVEFEAGSTSNR